MKLPLRLAVVGGRRGSALNEALGYYQDRVQLAAICDPQYSVLDQWREEYPDIKTYTSYESLLESGECDAVYIATPLQLHATQSIAAMQAGLHVLCEVTAATTLKECWQLVETVEQTGCTYMMAENCCYMRQNMMVLRMVQQGVFGDTIYAEGGYLHDCRNLMYYPDGALTWRGKMRCDLPNNNYPTHSLGPVAQWLGTSRGGNDRLARTVTMVSPCISPKRYAAQKFGIDHPALQEGFFKNGDSASTMIQTERGVVIYLRIDWASARPMNNLHYVLQGTQAAYQSARQRGEDHLLWIEGRSPGESPGNAEWERLWDYAAAYEHPRWREWGERAHHAGHDGSDFFILADFVEAVLNQTPPPIEVYDAVTWSAITPLSLESVRQGNVPLEIPDFRRKRGAG